ncbi:hypothetical protein SCAR479_14013 [Seiridium cardinale]|uniref:Uncharacterized protein n=1 Tax=Seiridium cardinale TaxID=138064 RepID=A0ABR2X6R1_9PEZI
MGHLTELKYEASRVI